MRGQRILDRYGNAYDGNAPLITRRRGHSTLRLDARSGPLLNAAYATQADVPGMYQPFPTTAAGLLAALGNPAGWTTANIVGIPNITTASPWVDYLGLAPNFASAAGATLTQRECVGLPTSSFNAVVGYEQQDATGDRYQVANNAFQNVAAGSTAAGMMVFRIAREPGAGAKIAAKFDPPYNAGYMFQYSAGILSLSTYRAGTYEIPSTLVGTFSGGAWHVLFWGIDGDDGTKWLDADIGVQTIAPPLAGSISNTYVFALGAGINTAIPIQVGYLAFFNKKPTLAMRAAFWRPYATIAFNTPSVYTRTTPMRCAITASRVAAYGAGQVGVAFDAGAVDAAGGNALGTGVLMEEGATYLEIGTNNQAAWLTGAGGTTAPATGPDGMMSAFRLSTVAGAGYVNTGTAVLAGATAVPFAFASRFSTVAGGGTEATVGLLFAGDPGGSETLFAPGILGIGADWTTRVTFALTPTRNAHTSLRCRLYPNATLPDGVMDICVEYLIQNRALPIAAHALTGAAAVTTATPTWTIANPANLRFNPARGAVDFTVAGFPGVNGCTFLGFGAALAAGALVLDYNAGGLRLRIYDNTGALATTVVGAALDALNHDITVLYDAVNPLLGIGVPGQYAAICVDGVVVGTAAVSWVPAVTGPATLNIGTTSAGASPARCLII